MTKKVCCIGVCKGMSWDEAKEFIINKHNPLFWESWVDRVWWKEDTELYDTELYDTELYDSLVKKYDNLILAGRTWIQATNADGFIHCGPAIILSSAWREKIKQGRDQYYFRDEKQIWNYLGKCWSASNIAKK